MNDTVNAGVLSDKIRELVVQDLDYADSEVNRYIDNQALSLILTALPLQRRLEFYQFLGNNDFESAKTLISKHIPDFHKQLLVKVKEKFQEIL